MLKQSVGLTMVLGVLLFWMPMQNVSGAAVEEKETPVEKTEPVSPVHDEQKSLLVEVEDAVVELLYECSQRGYRFGDYKVETSDVTDGSPNPKYVHTAVTVRIPIVYKTA